MLPRMTWGNWFFWGIMSFIGIMLLWLGLLELVIPLWMGALVAVGVFLVLILWGPREHEEES